MMEVLYWHYTTEQLNEVMTKAMIATVGALSAEGLLDKAVAEKFADTHAVALCERKSWLYRWLEKFFPDTDDKFTQIVVVKIVRPEEKK